MGESIGPVTLPTDRFVLRPFRPNDESSFAYVEDPVWGQYLFAAFPDRQTFVANNVATDWGSELNLVIDDQGAVLGSVHLGLGGETGVGELACLIGPEHWHAGVALEACACLLDHAFAKTQLTKAFAHCDSRNRRSWRVLEKLGMVREATLRRHRLTRDGGLVDELCFGILREEWQRRTPDRSEPRVLLISGPVGVGKTTVANEVSEQLEKDEVAHTFLDFDTLRYTYPRPADDPWRNRLAFDHLKTIWQRCVAEGVANLVIATVVEDQDFIEQIKAAVPGADVVTCQLEATPATLASRVRQRELGAGLDWHLARAEELHGSLAKPVTPCDLRIDADARSVGEVAADIVARVTWR